MVKEDGLSIVPGPLVMRIHDVLPFRLTNAQQRVLEVIFRDMAAPHPMNRLVQGDVGSGKTIVAFCAALAALDSGYQVAFMAPTELLAEQHFRTLAVLAKQLDVSITLLTGDTKPKAEARDVQSHRTRKSRDRGRHSCPDSGRGTVSIDWG